MNKIKIGLIGHTGRMGKQILSIVRSSENVLISSCFSGSVLDIKETQAIELKIASSIAQVCHEADVVIEFTNPETMEACLIEASRSNTPIVSGTTGHDNYRLMNEIAENIPVLWSANMSLGINILLKTVKDVAKALSEDYDIEISETHHAKKKDFPSGTSIMLGKVAAQGRGVGFESAKSINRDKSRERGEIGFVSLRGGGVFGEHKVMFMGEDECLELNHVALSRELFAKGAVKAGLWLFNQKQGLYSMQDVLSHE